METIFLFMDLIPVFVLLLLGFLIKYKKAYWLISGYNTMSAEKKKNVDIEGLANLAANICFVIAAIIFTAFIFLFFKIVPVALIIFALLLPVIIYTLINAQKYDMNARNSEGKMKTQTKLIIGSIIAFLILCTAGVSVLVYFTAKPAEYTLENGVFKISGMYGQKVPVNEITGLELKETIPEIITRTNGSDIGSKKKGHFKLKDIGSVKLFTDVSKPPFIYIKSNSDNIILNCEDGTKTRDLYERLRAEWQKSVNR